MYRPVKHVGDGILVPQMVFSKLGIPGSDDGRFRVALQILADGKGDILSISEKLCMAKSKVEAALNFWNGAGLIEEEAKPTDVLPPEKPRTMTTAQVVSAGKTDPTLGFMLDELQRLFGSVIGENDTNVFVSLYVQDGFAADLILMAASQAAANGALRRASYTGRILASWQANGINTPASADAHLKLQAQRALREEQLAKKMNFAGANPFSLADKKKIAQWFEEFSFNFEMVEAALLVAAEKGTDVKYLHGILKKWYAKGYCSPKDVQAAGENANLRARRGQSPNAKDVLMDAVEYVPLKKRGPE